MANSMIVKPIRPPPTAATNIRNLEVACIATLQERVRCATYNGKQLYTSDHKGVLFLWNIADATNVKFHDGVGIPINVLQGANDGKDVWLGFSDGDIAIMNIENKSVGTRWKGHPGGVSCIVALTNSVWSGGVDFQIRKWGLTGDVLMAYGHHHTSVRWLCMVQKELHDLEMQLWSSSNEPEIARCSILDDKLQHNLLDVVKRSSGHTLAVLVLCQVGKNTVWSGSEDNLIKVWSVLDMSLKHTMQGHKGPVCSLVEMGFHVWSGSADSTILVWDATTYSLLYSLGDQGGYVKSMVKADWQLWAFASGKNIKIWTAASLWDVPKVDLEKLKEKMKRILIDKEKSEVAHVKAKEDAERIEQELKEMLRKQKNLHISEIGAKSDELIKLKDNLIQKINDLESNKKQLEDEKTKLTKETTDFKMAIEKFKMEKDIQEDSNKNIQIENENKIAGLDSMLKDVQQNLKDVQGEKNIIQKHIEIIKETAEEEIARIKEQLEKCRNIGEANSEAADAELTKLREQLEKARSVATNMSENIENLTILNDELQKELDSTKTKSKDEIENLKQQIERNMKEAIGFKEKLQKDLEYTKNIAKDEFEKLKQDMENERNILAKTFNDKDVINEELTHLKEQMDKEKTSAKVTIEKVKLEFEEEMKKMIEKINKEREVAKTAFQSAKFTSEDKISKLKVELENTQEQMKKALAEQSTNAEQIKRNYTNELDAANAQHASLQEAFDVLEKAKVDSDAAFILSSNTTKQQLIDLQEELADAKDQLQKALEDASQNAQEKDGEVGALRDEFSKQIANLEEALKAANGALDAANANAASTADAASQPSEELAKQVADLLQELSDANEAADAASKLGKTKVAELSQQLEEARNEAEASRKVAEELAQQLENAKNQADAASEFSEAVATDLAKQLEDAESTAAELVRQIEEAKEAAESAGSEADALARELEDAKNNIVALSKQLKDAQTQAEAANSSGAANAELSRLLEDARRQLQDANGQIGAARRHAEDDYFALSRQLVESRKVAENATREAQDLRKQTEVASRLAERAAQDLNRKLEEARGRAEAASLHSQTVAADARELIAGLKGQVEGLEFALSKMSREDVQNLVAERDELLQKLQENADKAAADAEAMSQLRDSLTQVAAEKDQLQNELNLAQDAYNTRYDAGKAPSKRYSATVTPQINPLLPLEDVSNIGGSDPVLGPARTSITGSKGNPVALGDAFASASISGTAAGSSRRTAAVAPSRRASGAAGSQFGLAGDILGGSLRRSLRGANTAGGGSRRASAIAPDAQRASLPAQSIAEDLTQRASFLAESNAEVLEQRASMLAENTADALAQSASLLAENSAERLAEGGLVLAEKTADVLTQRASILAESAAEALPSRPSLLAQRGSSRRLSAALSEVVTDVPRASLRKFSGTGASRRSLTAITSRRASTTIPSVLQEPEDLIRRSVRASVALAGPSRRSSALIGSRVGTSVLPDKLQEKLENLENEIMEAKRNSLLAGSFRMGEGMRVEEPMVYDLPEVYTVSVPSRRASAAMPENLRRYSSMPPGMAAEAGGSSRSSTRSGSSQGSRLVEEAANLERIANLKARVSMLECERERERIGAFEAAKAYDKSDEMMRRIQQLESALQQAHEDYKILSNETKQLHCMRNSNDRSNDRDKKKCPQDLLRELECEIDKKRRDLEFAEFSMKKVMEKYGKCIKTASSRTPPCITDGSISRQPNNCGPCSLEFTHFTVGNAAGAPSKVLKMVTFSTSGPMGPHLTRIVEQVGKSLPQIVMREIDKIARDCMQEETKDIFPCTPPEKEVRVEPMIVYQPAPRPCTHDEEVQTESPLVRFKEKERYLSGHGPYRVDRIKSY